MPNSYFRFKQFTIHQDRCAMKVCTDSCILGAWSAQRIDGVEKILDIGTGTGLLPLMLAQQSGARLDTIETDPESVRQAAENISRSPWSDRIRLIEGDVRKFSFENKYDFIITNPPFYESSLRSPIHEKNKARHDESLTLQQLLAVITSCLNASGSFTILLPFHRTTYFEKLAREGGFFMHEKITICQTPGHTPFRSIFLFKKIESLHARTGQLTIKNKQGKYSPEFSDLMNSYY